MFLFYFFILGGCFVLLYFAGGWVVNGLTKIARFLGWKEFVVAFIVMASAASLPNLFVGIFSAYHKVPQLSLGEIMAGSLIALTIGVGLAVLFSKEKNIPAQSKTIQSTSFFTLASALLPMILILDRNLSRIDGALLICFFLFYIFWLFSKKERFTKIFNHENENISILKEFRSSMKEFGKVILGIILLLLAAGGIVSSATFFANFFNLPIILIGLVIVGLGNALPEIYFAIISSRRGESWMILGNLMGSVIFTTTLVLGIVALIYPIYVSAISYLALTRIFLVLTVLFFFISVKTHQKITKKEAFILLAIYLIFILTLLFAISI